MPWLGNGMVNNVSCMTISEKILFSVLCVAFSMFSCAPDAANRQGTKLPSENNNAIITQVNAVSSTKKDVAVNVFVENSGSMFGYIQTGGKYNPSTDFAATLSNYMTKLVLSDFVTADSLKLHYINSKIFAQSLQPNDFVKNLTSHTAKTWGGDLTTTDMSTLFEMVMKNTKQNEVSIFISDCIFSPQKGVDAANYLVSQKNAISYAVKANSKNNFTFVCHRLMSKFDGKYYDCTNKPTVICDQRPYFIWIVGNAQLVSKLEKLLPPSEFGVKNTFTIFKPTKKEVKYFVKKTIGEGENDGQDKLKNVELDSHAGKFTMTLYVDLSKIPLGGYLTDVSHYTISNKNYKIEKIVRKPFAGATHQIIISTTMKPSPSVIEVKLKSEKPAWVDNFSCDTDVPIANYMDKTFGIKQIIDGVFDAYYYGTQNDLASMKININN